jgi:hypothetical protein
MSTREKLASATIRSDIEEILGFRPRVGMRD